MELGYEPLDLTVHLTTDADFEVSVALNADWPAGATLVLKIGAAEWSATLSGREAVFSVDKASTNAIANGATAKLVYTSGTIDQIWALGKVVRHG